MPQACTISKNGRQAGLPGRSLWLFAGPPLALLRWPFPGLPNQERKRSRKDSRTGIFPHRTGRESLSENFTPARKSRMAAHFTSARICQAQKASSPSGLRYSRFSPSTRSAPCAGPPSGSSSLCLAPPTRSGRGPTGAIKGPCRNRNFKGPCPRFSARTGDLINARRSEGAGTAFVAPPAAGGRLILPPPPLESAGVALRTARQSHGLCAATAPPMPIPIPATIGKILRAACKCL